MIQIFNDSLVKHSKSKLLSDALLYNQINTYFQKNILDTFPELKDDFQNLIVQFKMIDQVLNIKLISNSNTFLAFLKTEIEDIQQGLSDYLNIKKLIDTNTQIKIKCLGK